MRDAGKRSAELRARCGDYLCRERLERSSATPWFRADRSSSPRDSLPSLGPHVLIRWDDGGAVNQQVPVVGQPHLQPRQRLGRRAIYLCPLAIELAAMARA